MRFYEDWLTERTSKAAYARWAKQTAPDGEPGEFWRDVPTHPGYQASNLGRIRSRYAILKPCITSTGYMFVCPSIEGRQKRALAHRMVAAAFHGPAPEGHECRHLNGDRSDNRPENLAWGTREENQNDRFAHATSGRGENNGRAKLTNAQRDEAMRRLRAGESLEAVAAAFDVSRSHLSNLRAGRRGGDRKQKRNPPTFANLSAPVAHALELVRSGHSARAAAAAAGANLTTVRCYVSHLRAQARRDAA